MAELALTYKDYTVGWICALELEQAAAVALLDSEHPRLPSITGDPNRYRFGSTNGHNIVVACLPDGETGNPAAAGATLMTINFPSQGLDLMKICVRSGIECIELIELIVVMGLKSRIYV
jgi:hypothetical protein